jgi:membrane-bound lytic murein transglycosylase MltF
MQIKPSTAASKQVGVTPVTTLENNIKAGVKYLRYIADHYFATEPMSAVNRTLFCMASYNAGPNRIAQLRREAQEAGFDPNVWFNNVEIIAAKRIGRETTHYVANIYKYFLAYQEIANAEASRKAAPSRKR